MPHSDLLTRDIPIENPIWWPQVQKRQFAETDLRLPQMALDPGNR